MELFYNQNELKIKQGLSLNKNPDPLLKEYILNIIMKEKKTDELKHVHENESELEIDELMNSCSAEEFYLRKFRKIKMDFRN